MSKPKRNAMAESLSIGHFGPDAALCRDTAEFHHRGADRPDICPNYATTTWIPPFLARVHPFSSAEIGAYGGTLKSLGNMAGTQFRTWFRPTFCRGVRDGQCSLFSAVRRRCLRGGLVLRADIKRSGRGQPSGGAPIFGLPKQSMAQRRPSSGSFSLISLLFSRRGPSWHAGRHAGRTALAPSQIRPPRPACTPTKPFWGTRETDRKQSGRKRVGNEEASSGAGRHQMNHSIHSADRATHLKIVVVALVAGICVAAFGIAARTNVDYSQTAHVIKAGKPVVVTSSDTSLVR